MNRIYLDHSASTPVDPRVLEAMLPYFTEIYGNSKAIHSFGHEAEQGIEAAHEAVARRLNCQANEVIFTSGGTESDNLALRGPAQYARAYNRPFTIITCPVEHAAITATARQLVETLNAGLRLVPVDRFGQVQTDDLRDALRNLPSDGITLVSLVHANNEIGTVHPLAEYAQIVHEHGAIFHTDTVQSPGHLPLDVEALGVDMLSLSSHKFYGPKGAGVFYLRKGTPFVTAQSGANHEDGHRGGTHNTPGIVGTAKALDLACDLLPETVARETPLRDHLIAEVLARVPEAQLTGHPTDRLSSHASFVFKDILSSTLLMILDQQGIAASSGSACKVGNEKPSELLRALGLSPAWTRGGLRLTLGRSTTEADVERVIAVLPEAVATARKLFSPVVVG
jgi:cysteine desulfurase